MPTTRSDVRASSSITASRDAFGSVSTRRSVTPPSLALWGLTKPEHVEFVKPREVRHPYRTMTQHIRLNGHAAHLPKTFIYCSSPATGSFDQFAAKYRNDPAWRFHQLPTGHDAMILMPEAVTRILLERTARA
jgi:hypothetical protein